MAPWSLTDWCEPCGAGEHDLCAEVNLRGTGSCSCTQCRRRRAASRGIDGRFSREQLRDAALKYAQESADREGRPMRCYLDGDRWLVMPDPFGDAMPAVTVWPRGKVTP